jgi:hypothetical protein
LKKTAGSPDRRRAEKSRIDEINTMSTIKSFRTLLLAAAVIGAPSLAMAEGAGPDASNATYASRSAPLNDRGELAFQANQGEGASLAGSNATYASRSAPVTNAAKMASQANQGTGESS